VQSSYAPDSLIPHQAGGFFAYRGTGGGAPQVVVWIDLKRFSNDLVLQVSLTHELVHALRMIVGSSMHRDMGSPARLAWDSFEEFVACAIENAMRSELGLELRVTHNDVMADPFFAEAATQAAGTPTRTTQRQSLPADRVPMGTGGSTPSEQAARALSVSRHYVESIETNRRELARLSEGFAARYRRELQLVRQWHQTLVDRLNAEPVGVLPFNPFRHV
jgi:hypothetical protein